MELIWSDKKHFEFYNQSLYYAVRDDTYHKALFYALGCCYDTRANIDSIYDFRRHQINPDVLEDGWVTGGARKVILLAFNLFNGFTLDDGRERLSTPYELFDCDYAPYMLTAIKLRYPESFDE